MQLIIDTETGLTAVDGQTDFKRLDAVVIGQGSVPDYLGTSDEAHVWIFTRVLEQLLDLRCDKDRDAFCGMIGFARTRQWLKQTEGGEQVRVHVAERITMSA
ncbi:MAG TPA: hypothetical protein GX700_01435 [Paracoccus sp.]|nr:hypothetical protein [Paracoccus sp. (in: a-proteobacteria)]